MDIFDKNQFIDVIKPNLTYIATCCGLIIITLLAGIWPYQKITSNQQEEINALIYQIKEQEALSPVLKKLIESANLSGNELLMMEKDQPEIVLRDTSSISQYIKQSALRSGLSVLSLVPELKSLTKDSNFLPFEMKLQGSLNGLRSFLMTIGRLQFLEHIETIDINSRGRMKEYFLKVWISYNK
jgi:Tfp pilus assembly protein PilO